MAPGKLGPSPSRKQPRAQCRTSRWFIDSRWLAPPGFRPTGPQGNGAGPASRHPTAAIMSKIGKYMATIMPPTTAPSTRIMAGSIAAMSASSALSTSWS